MRIPVISQDDQPLMPTTPARARKWIASGKAIKRWSDCGQLVKAVSNRLDQPPIPLTAKLRCGGSTPEV